MVAAGRGMVGWIDTFDGGACCVRALPYALALRVYMVHPTAWALQGSSNQQLRSQLLLGRFAVRVVWWRLHQQGQPPRTQLPIHNPRTALARAHTIPCVTRLVPLPQGWGSEGFPSATLPCAGAGASRGTRAGYALAAMLLPSCPAPRVDRPAPLPCSLAGGGVDLEPKGFTPCNGCECLIFSPLGAGQVAAGPLACNGCTGCNQLIFAGCMAPDLVGGVSPSHLV